MSGCVNSVNIGNQLNFSYSCLGFLKVLMFLGLKIRWPRGKKISVKSKKNLELKISNWIHFRAQIFSLNSFQSTKFQTEIISEHKISDWISDWSHFRAQNFRLNFRLKSFQSTKFQTEVILGHKISDWISDWNHFRAQHFWLNSFQL